MSSDPLKKTREDYQQLIDQISMPGSPVGIDAQLTHAIIIEYLRRIDERLDRLEQALNEPR